MSRGKYSLAYKHWPDNYDFKYNSKKEIVKDFDPSKETFDAEIHMGNFDEEGFDTYGYSSYDEDGKFVGIGEGIDRAGYTFMQYLSLDDLGPYEKAHYYD